MSRFYCFTIHSLYSSSFFCCTFDEKEFALSVCLFVCHENLTLAISLPFLNISLLNFQIILLMTTWTQWCQIHYVMVIFARVFFNYLVTVRKHSRCVPINTHLVFNSHQTICFCLQVLFTWLWFVSKMSSFLPLIKNKITMFKKMYLIINSREKCSNVWDLVLFSDLGRQGSPPLGEQCCSFYQVHFIYWNCDEWVLRIFFRFLKFCCCFA